MSDPIGTETAQGILDKTTLLAQLPVWRDPLITIIALVLMSVGVVLSLVVVRKLIVEYVSAYAWRSVLLYLLPGLYGGAFMLMLIGWGFRIFRGSRK